MELGITPYVCIKSRSILLVFDVFDLVYFLNSAIRSIVKVPKEYNKIFYLVPPWYDVNKWYVLVSIYVTCKWNIIVRLGYTHIPHWHVCLIIR